MNPMTNVKNIKKLSEQDIRLGGKSSWHDQYKDSAWIFIGGFPYDLTEGDIICVFSQYGEVVNINLVRDKETGKQRGFCFLCYEDQKSTILAVDNFNGIKILGRTLRVDHVENYKAPKEGKNPVDDETRLLREEGCAPSAPTAPPPSSAPQDLVVGGVRLPPRLPIQIKTERESPARKSSKKKKEHKVKKEKKSKKEHKKRDHKNKKKRSRKASKSDSSSSSTSSSDSDSSDDERERRKTRERK